MSSSRSGLHSLAWAISASTPSKRPLFVRHSQWVQRADGLISSVAPQLGHSPSVRPSPSIPFAPRRRRKLQHSVNQLSSVVRACSQAAVAAARSASWLAAAGRVAYPSTAFLYFAGGCTGRRSNRNREPSAPPRAPSFTGESLDALIARWRGPLVGLFLARGLGRGMSHELTGEVFVEAWLGLREGRFHRNVEDQAAVGAWLRGIARNLAAAHSRRTRSAPRSVDQGELSNVAEVDAPAPDSDQALRQAIDRLPRALREVVLVRYLDEHTGIEAAAILGLTEKAVERRAARARDMLRERMRGEEIQG